MNGSKVGVEFGKDDLETLLRWHQSRLGPFFGLDGCHLRRPDLSTLLGRVQATGKGGLGLCRLFPGHGQIAYSGDRDR